MLENFIVVAQQVLVLFILISLGFACGKKKIITDVSAKHINNLVLYFVTPCVMVSAFQRDFTPELLGGLGIMTICATAVMAATILLVSLIFKGKDSKKRVLRFATVFSNCAFMSFPLQEAVLGDDGLFYGAVFVAVFNILVWTYGLVCMSGDIKEISAKKLITNPGIIGVVIAIIIFALNIRLPYMIGQPVEYMAALMTSVIDNPSKVAEYIYASRQMGIQILPPDINNGEADFSVDEGNIRYGLSAIKSVGRPVVRAMLEERRTFGPYKNLEDFITRVSSKEGLNKRTIENLIKAGALDTLGGTRKQFMSIYIQIMDHVNQEKKYSMSGQMSLFDLVGEEEKADFQIRMPDVGEYSKENKLAFEKEVLGVYISGHPLEEHEERWRRMISATTADFQFDEELNRTKVHDGEKSVVGGMIVDKTVKYTKTNQVMAFLTLEDLLGTVEVVIFPRDYEKNRQWLEINEKVFISGRVSEEDEKASKLICEKVIPFERTKRELWIQFPDKETFLDEEQIVYGYLADSEGEDEVIIYCAKERAVKRLPKNRNIQINEQVLSRLMNHFGESRVKVVEKAIENHF